MSFGILMFFSSFLFLDWKFRILNLRYSFDTTLEQKKAESKLIKFLFAKKNKIFILII